MIYADNAATTKLAPEALDAMMPFLTTEYGNASQPYSFSRSARRAIKEARETIAQCINADPEEIVFTSGGTEGDNWAIKETMLDSASGSELIISEIEHHALLNSALSLQRFGYKMTVLPVDNFGRVNPLSLNATISNTTKLVSIMFSNNEIGTIQPIKELAKITHNNNARFHTDAVQAVGHIKIDVRDLDIDMLTASAHKFNGPKGVGFLYVRKGITIDSFIHGGTQEKGLRAGTENVASIVGMAKALETNCTNMESNKRHIRNLEKLLIEKLRESDLDFIQNGGENRIPGNISISFRAMDGESLLHRLDLMGICVSTGAACNSSETEVSHVLQAIKIDKQYAQGTIRISLGKYNTYDDIAYIASSIIKIVNDTKGFIG